jgi:Protein of unknown function (DUF3500)
MNHKPLIATTLVIGAASTAVACGATSGDAASTSSAPVARSSAATAGGSDSRSAKKYRAQVVKATNAWLTTLTAAQRKTATYGFGDTSAKEQWSNFPAFFKPRTGVSYKGMGAASTKAGVALVKATLSRQGYTQYAAIRKADDYQAATDTGAPGGPGTAATPTPTPVPQKAVSPAVTSGDGNGSFGRNNYYISVFGKPSASKPFMVSFNGHHMSFNITFGRTRLANTPEFTGTEPSNFIIDKKDYRPMKQEAAAVFGLLPKLPSSAKLSESFDDVLVGPQKDGQFPSKHSGVKVTKLSASARKYVTRLITSYVADVPPAIAKPLIARYKKQYSHTYVAYSGGTRDTPGTYVRIDGPQAWIEFAVQSSDKGTSHYHSVYRDKQHDYGA